MPELLASSVEVLAEFARSDAGPVAAPDWHATLSVQMAHILIGVTLALYRAPFLLVLAVFVGWIAKEFLGDIPNADGAFPVVADSVADLYFGGLGYLIAKSKLERKTNDES